MGPRVLAGTVILQSGKNENDVPRIPNNPWEHLELRHRMIAAEWKRLVTPAALSTCSRRCMARVRASFRI